MSLSLVKPAIARNGNPPIIVHGAGNQARQVEESIIVDDPTDVSRVRQYYSGVAADGKARIAFCTALKTADPTLAANWSAPTWVLTDRSRRLDSIIIRDGVWYLYATDCEGSNYIEVFTSSDGVAWLDRGVALAPTSDENNVSQGAVIWDGATAYMLYSYRTAGATLPGIRVATSATGLAFVASGGGDVLHIEPRTRHSTFIEWHQLVKVGQRFIMVLECYDGSNWRVQLASSLTISSGWSWSPFAFNFTNVQGTFDMKHVATGAIWEINGRSYLFYQGGAVDIYANSLWDIAVAPLTQGATIADFI